MPFLSPNNRGRPSRPSSYNPDSGIYLWADGTEWWTVTTSSGATQLVIPNEVISNGLVAQYTFEEGSGSTLVDHSGNGYNGTLGLSGSQLPTWNSTGLVFNGNSLISLPISVWPTVRTVQIFCSCTPLSNNTQFLINLDNFYLSGAGQPNMWLRSGSGQLSFGGWEPQPACMSGYAVHGNNCLTAVLDSTAISLYFNTSIVPSYALYQGGYTPYTPTTLVYLGYNQGFSYVGTMYYIVLYNRELSQLEINTNYLSISTVLNQRGVVMADRTPNQPQLIFTGDSQCAGGTWYTSGNQYGQYPTKTMSLLSKTYNWSNQGYSGQLMTIIGPGVASNANPLWPLYSSTPKILILEGGVNDLPLNYTAQNIYTSAKSGITLALGAGATHVILLGIPNQSNSVETKRQAYRALASADFNLSTSITNVFTSTLYGPNVYYYDDGASTGLEANIGAPGASSNSTYFVDGTHLTISGGVLGTGGYGIIALALSSILKLIGLS